MPERPPCAAFAVAVERRLAAVATSARDAGNEKHATRHELSPDFVRAVIQAESAFNPYARSPKGAMGLMQLMPATARRFNVADPYNPQANIEGGIKYLRVLLDRFPERLALAAYNAGEAAVERFRGIPPYAETRDYVTRVLRLVGR